ncbi:hypothetical protein F5Y17DRAFT_256931 [Xylariaceae sp. FL0594]|nr:hypothetical protein F5Y17DRAFT_256931 [Xylariaceae sp. FL0594]
MVRLPPVEKLPLALRKSVRDSWDVKKAGVEKKISDILGVEWTIDVNPNQIFAYAKPDNAYVQQNLGSCLYEYFDDASRRLEDYENAYKQEGIDEINTICHAHVMTLDVDEEGRFSYCGADVKDGKLRLVFNPERLGANISDALSREVLAKALNEAPAPEGSAAPPLSFAARSSIRKEYDPKIDAVRARVGEILAKPDIKLNPNFEANFAKLQAESKVKKTDLRQDWESVLGSYTLLYFEGLVSQLQWQKFPDDDLLQEGLNEAVDKGEIVLRIVDNLKNGTYNEAVIEDGVLYLQTTPQKWGSNITDAAQNLVDML